MFYWVYKMNILHREDLHVVCHCFYLFIYVLCQTVEVRYSEINDAMDRI